MKKRKRFENTQSAQNIINALSNVGYTLPETIAEMIDNSIDAGAKKIWVDISNSNGERSVDALAQKIQILDDGTGMNRESFDNCLTLGSNSDCKSSESLGGYGLGLKTASSKIGDKLEVLTSSGEVGQDWYASIDFTKIEDGGELIERQNSKQRSNFSKIFKSKGVSGFGTIIIIQKLKYKGGIVGLIQECYNDISLRYCKVMKNKGVSIYLNNKKIPAYDPVNNPKTKIVFSKEVIYKGEAIPIRIAEYIKKSYRRGGTRQGFHTYRNDRKISRLPNRFGVFRIQGELQLLEMEILFPKSLDVDFGVPFSKNLLDPSPEVIAAISKAVNPFINSYVIKKQSESFKPINDSLKAIAEKRFHVLFPDFGSSPLNSQQKGAKVKPKKSKGFKIYEANLPSGAKGPFQTYGFIGNDLYITKDVSHPYNTKYVSKINAYPIEQVGVDIDSLATALSNLSIGDSRLSRLVCEELLDVESKILDAYMKGDGRSKK